MDSYLAHLAEQQNAADTYLEHLVKHKKSNADRTQQALLLAGAVFAVLMACYLSLYLIGYLQSIGSLLSVLLIAGICYGTYKLILRFNVEYEYIFTNGELDVDKITARRERKRLLTVETKTFTAFGSLTQEILNGKVDTRVLAESDFNRPDARYALFETPALGKTMLVFNPSEEMCAAIMQTLPARLRTER